MYDKFGIPANLSVIVKIMNGAVTRYNLFFV